MDCKEITEQENVISAVKPIKPIKLQKSNKPRMNVDEAVAFLSRYIEIKKGIVKLKLNIDSLYSKSTNTAVSIQERVQSTPSGDGFTIYTNEVVDQLEILTTLYQKERETMRDILNVISVVPNSKQYNILKMRYIYGWSWKQIHESVSFCDRQCSRIHREGLETVQKILDKRKQAK